MLGQESGKSQKDDLAKYAAAREARAGRPVGTRTAGGYSFIILRRDGFQAGSEGRMTFELFPAIRLSQMRVTRQGVGRGGRGMANWLCGRHSGISNPVQRVGDGRWCRCRCWVLVVVLVVMGGTGGSGRAGGW